MTSYFDLSMSSIPFSIHTAVVLVPLSFAGDDMLTYSRTIRADLLNPSSMYTRL